MQNVCVRCQTQFFYGKKRSVCFGCVPPPLPISKERLVQEYMEGASYRDLKCKYGLTQHIIEGYIHAYGKPRMCVSKQEFKAVTIDQEWLDGWLLGDGCLKKDPSSINAKASHGSKFCEYTDYVRGNWLRMGLTAPDILKEWDAKRECWKYSVASRVHPALTEQWRRWYPTGEKRIPQDLKVTPVSVREWYYGDGSFDKRDQVPSLVLGGVTEEEANRLKQIFIALFSVVTLLPYQRKQLTESGAAQKPYYFLNLTKESAPSFFEFIGSCTLPCYGYKWPIGSIISDTAQDSLPWYHDLHNYVLSSTQGASWREGILEVSSLQKAFHFVSLKRTPARFVDMHLTSQYLSRGYRLYHLREWVSHEILFSKLRSLLGRSECILYARNGILGEVTGDQVIEFLDTNHVHGSAKFLLALGLFFSGQLMMVITFRKVGVDCLEIARFATKKGHQVVGGFSRLWKHSVSLIRQRCSEIRKVITYADKDFSPKAEETVYFKQGFKFIGDTGPSMSYTDKERVWPRQVYQKHKLLELFPSNFNPALSEIVNLANNGIYPVYTSGNWKFEFTLC